MKKIFFLALLIPIFLGLHAGVASASVPDKSCDPNIWDMMQRQADAVRIRDKAYTSTILKQNDPVSGLTCFDQQLKLTSKLGALFSDKNVDYHLSFSSLFCSLGTSLTSSLSGQISAAGITEALNEFLQNNFSGSLSMSLLSSMFTWINDLPSNLKICSPTVSVPTVTLSVHVPGWLSAVAACVGIPLSVSFGGNSFAYCASVPLPAWLAFNPCTYVDKLWKSGGAGSGSLEGSGVAKGTPYTSMKDLLSGSLPADMANDFKKELDIAKNKKILTQALTDLTDSLSGPGKPDVSSSWKVTPTIPANASVADILKFIP